MNLRILKKLSKRVKPLIYGKSSGLEFFLADSHDNYTNTHGHDRKHWERMQSGNSECFFKKDIKIKTKNGFILMSEQYIHPWKNTEMVGWMSGYEEPEWEEETAWDRFCSNIWYKFNDYVEVDGCNDQDGYPKFEWKSKRKLNNPSDYFKAFNDCN